MALEQVANDAIQYRKSVAEQSKTRHEKPLPALKVVIAEEPTAKSANTADTIGTVNASANQASHSNTESSAKLTRRASRLRTQRTMPTVFTGEVLPDGNDTFLRETVIEVVRYRSPIHAAQESDRENKDSAVTQVHGNSMPSGNVSTIASKDSFNQGVATSTKGLVGQTISYDLSHTASQSGNRDESLKYLLWHINGSKEPQRKSSEKTA
jgi:hypothetical protein